MKLKTLIAAALSVAVAGALILPDDAEARRFGGGRSLGKQSTTTPRQAQQPQQAQQAQPQQAQPQRAQPQAAAPGQRPPQSGASRWLGPLAGLAAGGLLASLFFGDAFSGLQVMDFLLLALLAVGAFFLIRMLLRRASGRPSPAAAGAGAAGSPYARESAAPANAAVGAAAGERRTGGFVPPGRMGAAPPEAAGRDQFPYWFDGPGFIEGARIHFIRLQAAWDAGDFDSIREYVTPGLFAELQAERGRLGGTQETEVVQLKAELLTLQREGDLAIAGIRFSGLIREEVQGVAEPFAEVWHVQHTWASPEGDWYIAGIRQIEGQG